MEEKPKQTRNQPAELIKIVLYGPESTGKTTLAKLLAAHYQTLWVPEFMRDYLQRKWDVENEKVTKDDLLPIAFGQLKAEKEVALKASKLLFCDTNLLEIKVYSEYYYDGFCPSEIITESEKDDYQLYLLMDIDTVWEADDLRDRPEDRQEMFRIFEAELTKQGFPYKVISGSKEMRFKKAVEVIDELLKQ